MELFFKGFEKQAAKNDDPSWWEKQKGVYRAMQASDKGVGQFLANSELVGDRMKRGLGHGLVGAAGGAGLGALAGAGHSGSRGALVGAGLGGLAGLLGGDVHGQYTADKKYLDRRGIKQKYLGLSSDFSPEAKKKYIDKYKK